MYEDGAVINVKATDDHIRERDGFLEILAPPRKPKLGFDTYAGWLAYVMPNDTLFVKRFPTYPDRVYNEAAGLTLSVWYPDRPADRTRADRPAGAAEARRVGVVHRGLVAAVAPVPEEGAAARPEGARRAGREADDRDEVAPERAATARERFTLTPRGWRLSGRAGRVRPTRTAARSATRSTSPSAGSEPGMRGFATRRPSTTASRSASSTDTRTRVTPAASR